MKHYPRVSLYALMLAAAGIPLYIHLPRFAAINLGIGLGAIGTILLLIRLVDLVQDPAIGWAIDRWPGGQASFALLACAGLGIGFPLLFGLQGGPFVAPALVAILILLFSAYSLGMILLYGRSETLAQSSSTQALTNLAVYREAGMLAGVLLAAIAPSAFVAFGALDGGYPVFGMFLAIVAIVTAVVTRPVWSRPPVTGAKLTLSGLANAGALRLLLLALVNSVPVAITSTLFVFFVEDRLQLAGWSGPFLILFFLSAGASIPIWSRVSAAIGSKMTLVIAMPLAIAGFAGAAFLPAGQIVGFALICMASGAALGADMVVIPVMFSVALSRAGLQASAGFGIWSFAGKLGLALAAATVLPILEGSGFQPGEVLSPQASRTLTISYAVVPCLLKLLALALVLMLPASGKSTAERPV